MIGGKSLHGVRSMAKIVETFASISGALETLAQQILNIVSEDRTFAEIWGWNMPQINRHDFAALVRSPITKIQKISNLDIEESDSVALIRYPAMIQWLSGNVIANLPGGNAFHVYLTVSSTINSLNIILDKYVGQNVTLDEIKNKKLLPMNMIHEITAVRGQIDNAKHNANSVEQQLKILENSTSLIANLDVEMQNLRQARDMFNETQGIISGNVAQSSSSREQISIILEEMKSSKLAADEIIQLAQAAFSAQTSIGLGKEFSERAEKLQVSLRWLSGVLIAVLGTAAYISYGRIKNINQIAEVVPLNLSLVWANVISMVISLGPTIWLAWLVTRQIGQRFRLAEDYAFKASIAKAYAGYREEAGRLKDIEFEKKLFETTIRRIDEEPLRYIDKESESTPLQDLLSKVRFSSSDTTALLALIAAIGANDKKGPEKN